LRHRSGGRVGEQQRQGIQRQTNGLDAVDFFNVLTDPELLAVTEAYLPEHRERLYPPTETLSMFLKQVLEEDGSCQKAVNDWATRRARDGLSVASVNTGAYCRARGRLPVDMVMGLTRHVADQLSRQAQPGWRWRGRKVKVVDGTGISMPDTRENQFCYPQPSSQAEGVGFPLARLTGVVCLSTGVLLDAAIGRSSGKQSSELDLFRGMVGALSDGDVLLADALYANYWTIAMLQAAGVDVVCEQHGSRDTDFRCGQSLGRRDHVVSWPKPKARPAWMTPEQYTAFADQIRMREVKVGGRILVTTLLNPRRVPKAELSRLYARRWNIELDLRNIKTTLGMDVLSCRTPEMVRKELWVYLLAYNLIRLLMAQAACNAGVHPRELSFKHTVQIAVAWLSQPNLTGVKQELLRLIAQLRVGNRPGRIEPRARKRRPKSYPWLKAPRDQARQRLSRRAYRLAA